MKKIAHLFPVIIFPYIFIITFIILIVSVVAIGSDPDSTFNLYDSGVAAILIILGVLCNLLALIFSILGARRAAKGSINVKDSAYANMMVKVLQIPAFVILFLLGLLSLALSVWGAGLLIVVIIVDSLTIFYSGINAVGACISAKNGKVISKSSSILFSILSFFYFVDIAMAIFLYMKTKND